jgi:hypothetical protein
MIVAQHIGSTHRYYSDEGSQISLDTVQNWRDVILDKLMGECSVDCSEVLACLRGYSGDDWDWLIAAISGDSGVREVINYPGSVDTPIAGASSSLYTDCDKDNLFGFCLQLVQLLNRLTENAFEVFEVCTNYLEALAALSDSIPLLTEVTDLAVWMQANALENYVANYDVALENEYACELFCRAYINDCQLSWSDVRQYFQQKLTEGLSEVDLLDWAQYVITGSWTGDDFCHLFISLAALVFELGGDWIGVRLEDVQRIVESYFNDPNTDWTTLCDCVAGWYAEFDFTQSQCAFDITYGYYEAGVGWHTTLNTAAEPDDQRIALELDLDSETTDIVKQRGTIAAYTPGLWDGGDGSLWAFAVGGFTGGQVLATRSQMEVGSFTKHVDYTMSACRIDARSARHDGGGGDVVVSKVELWGKGTAPTAISTNATDFDVL